MTNSLAFDGAITFLPTLNLAQTRDFYIGVLGLKLVVDQKSCLIFQIQDGVQFGFCQSEDALKDPTRIVLCLLTNDVEAWHENLFAQGIPCEGEPVSNPTYDITHFYVRDPNGYRIEIQRFNDRIVQLKVSFRDNS